MAASSYAMFWRQGDGPRVAGRVEVGPDFVELEATVPPAAAELVRFRDIARVLFERGILQLDRRTLPPLRIGSLDGPGTLRELADRLSEAAAVASRPTS